MQLQQLIDRMIDQAQEADSGGTYSLLLGTRPATEKEWIKGKKVYRGCSVAQTKYVPNYVVVLAPSPDNLGSGDLYEFHGRILNGEVTRYNVQRAGGCTNVIG
jgi:hypothetical protein